MTSSGERSYAPLSHIVTLVPQTLVFFFLSFLLERLAPGVSETIAAATAVFSKGAGVAC